MPHISPSSRASCRVVSIASSSCDLHHLVDDRQVQHVGDEAGADPLDVVLAGLQRLAGQSLGDHRAGGRLDGDHLDAGFVRLERLADAGDRAAGAHAGHDDVDRAVGVAPDLLGGGLAMDLRDWPGS